MKLVINDLLGAGHVSMMGIMFLWTQTENDMTFVIKVKEEKKKKRYCEIVFSGVRRVKKLLFLKSSIIVKVLSAGIKVFKTWSSAHSSQQKDAYWLQCTLEEIPKTLGFTEVVLLRSGWPHFAWNTVRLMEDEEWWILRIIQRTLSWGIKAFEVAVKASHWQKWKM